MKKSIIVLLSFWLFDQSANSQGCVVVRNISGFGQYNLTDNAFTTSDWQLNINNRYFKAFKDYKGTVDQKTPGQNESVVKSFSTDVSIARLLRNGWSLYLSIPFAANSRETSLEHGGANTKRHTTHSFGLGDIRFTAYKWLLQPTVKQKGNIQLGLGIKFPTGAYNYQDFFYRNDSVKVLAAVNPSIQLGDGGLGITTELSAFYSINNRINLFFNGFYLINPRDQNGTSNLKGRAPRPDQIANNTTVMSVPDQYSIRSGLNYQLSKIVLNASYRYEKVPAKDLIGGNKGFRRVASISSVETGLSYQMKNTLVFANIGIPFKRKIEQNTQNDFTPAGFANYIFTAGTQFKL